MFIRSMIAASMLVSSLGLAANNVTRYIEAKGDVVRENPEATAALIRKLGIEGFSDEDLRKENIEKSPERAAKALKDKFNELEKKEDPKKFAIQENAVRDAYHINRSEWVDTLGSSGAKTKVAKTANVEAHDFATSRFRDMARKGLIDDAMLKKAERAINIAPEIVGANVAADCGNSLNTEETTTLIEVLSAGADAKAEILSKQKNSNAKAAGANAKLDGKSLAEIKEAMRAKLEEITGNGDKIDELRDRCRYLAI